VKKQKKRGYMSNKNKKPQEKSAILFVKKGEKLKLKLYHVEWRDHAVSGNRSGWSSVEDVKVKALTCYTVGWQIDENDESIALAQNMGENATVGEITTILKSCIVKKKEL
jgi:hypothetical protein